MTTIEGLSWADNRAQLRVHAEELLRDGAGAAAAIGGGALGVEALELLYRRASNPEFAADALKLLHELQTHQVELDLLLEQIQSSENELIDELTYYKGLYTFAPVAYLVLAKDGRVVESNEAAAKLLGFAPEHSAEQTLTQYLAPESRLAVVAMMQSVAQTASTAHCSAQLSTGSQLSFDARLSPSGDGILLTVARSAMPEAHVA